MRFKKHVCEREDQCDICKEYVNQLDKERRTNKGGNFRNRILRGIERSRASIGKSNFNKPIPHYSGCGGRCGGTKHCLARPLII